MTASRILCSVAVCLSFASGVAFGQSVVNEKYGQPDRFRQLDEVLPTPNDYRTASGAPGVRYWQQKADYSIDVRIDDAKQVLIGDETITYQNNSPDTLRYLWVQLDQNRFKPDSISNQHGGPPSLSSGFDFGDLETLLYNRTFKGGVQLTTVADAATGRKLTYTVVGTNLRIELPSPLESGGTFRFRIAWRHNIPDSRMVRARGGHEFFEEDGNYIYEMAQWFPRMCAYSDLTGWQHKDFVGSGEFALEFGDYLVRITVPADHIVASTGELMNADAVLTAEQKNRFEEARTADSPVFVVTPEEAMENQKEGTEDEKTWIFKAANVRDFAFATSRKFIWDAMGHNVGGNDVMAMSFYPNEAEPLWSKYSTHAIIHTLNVYSRYTFDYPYPVAISVNGPVYGMEYPMICFNGPRPEKDGTYSERTKYGLISVVIHEVGHNYFPMIVNSDERQWTWMDEGLNTFLQYLAEVEWEEDYPARRGEPAAITSYMRSSNQVPVMTNSESILQFGPNAYSKPATALNILRETVLGRSNFDFAFREYSRRWMFRRPYPADFFRSMEDASGRDLDWFWRGWFYTTDHVDQAITNVEKYEIDRGDPAVTAKRRREERDARPQTLSQELNAPLKKRTDDYPDLLDFYNTYDDLAVSKADRERYKKMIAGLSDEERKLLATKGHFYVLEISNEGGLVMPVIIKATFADDSSKTWEFPVEVWAQNSESIRRLIISPKEVVRFELDPRLQIADTDRSNNYYPPKLETNRFQLFRQRRSSSNPMQRAGLGKKEEPAPAEEKSEE